jgi:hypothetical protein
MSWRDELTSAFAKKQEEIAEKGFHEQQFLWEAGKFFDEVVQPGLNSVAGCLHPCSSVVRRSSTPSESSPAA